MAFSSKKLSVFYTQMGTMIQAGVPIQTALDTMRRTAPSSMKAAVARINEMVGRGEPFHEALAAQPGRFAVLDQYTLKISEQSGALDGGLFSLANYYEKRANARGKIMVGLILPGILLIGAVLVPNLPNLVLGFLGLKEYSVLNYALDTSRVLLPLLLAPLTVTLLVRALLKAPGVNVVADRVLNAIPIFGRFRSDYALSLWTQSLRMMLKAGFGILEALEFASRFSSSPLLAQAYARMRPMLDRQMTVSQALAVTGLFPPMLIQLWTTGEESGKMDEMLDQLARHFDDQWQRSLALLAIWLPILVYFFVSVYIVIQIFKLMGAYVGTYDNLLRETQM